MTRNLPVFVLLQLMVLLLMTQVRCDLQFSLKIVRFSNPMGLHQDRKRCDLVAGQCDTFLEITVGSDTKTKSKRTTRTVQNKNNLQASDISPNPISFTMPAWPLDKPLRVHVSAWDEDITGNQIITSFSMTVSLTPQAFSRKTTYSTEITATDSAGRSLVYQVAAKCNDNYYGPACSHYCVDTTCDLTTATSTTTSTSTSATHTGTDNSTDTQATQPTELVELEPGAAATSNVTDATAVNVTVTVTVTVTATATVQGPGSGPGEHNQSGGAASTVTVSASASASDSDSDSDTSDAWQRKGRLGDNPAADAVVGADSDADATNSNVVVIVVVGAVVVLVCTAMAVLVLVRRAQSRKRRQSRVPVFDIDGDDDSNADDNRNTVTTYCGSDSCEPTVLIHGKSAEHYVRMTGVTAQHADDAFQNFTYGQHGNGVTGTGAQDRCDSASHEHEHEHDTCSVYSRPPAPRPVNDCSLFNNNRIVSQNIYSTPSESANTDVYYNHH